MKKIITFIYIKSISHLFNLSTHTGDKDSRFCPICSKKVPLKAYTAHICKCYKFAKESTCIKLPEEDTFMKFKKLQQVVRTTIHSECRHGMLTNPDKRR